MDPDKLWIYIEDFLKKHEELFDRCIEEIPFEQWTYRNKYNSGNRPRLSVFYNVEDDMPDVVLQLLSHINGKLLYNKKYSFIGMKEPFDRVLIHLYRDGYDHISWHPDREASDNFICGLSLGNTRKLNFRKMDNHSKKWEYILKPGSIYVMLPGCQDLYEHRIAKTVAKKQPGPRISFTFRQSGSY